MSEHDDDLRALLNETAEGITPRGGYEEIKERAMHENSNRKWVLPTLAAAAVMALVVGGIGWMLRDDDPAASPGPAQEPTAESSDSATDTPTTVEPKQIATTVYYAGNTTHPDGGHGLFPEVHPVDEMGTTWVADLEKAVQLAISGRPFDPDYQSLWPAGIAVRDVAFDGVGENGTVTISLTGPASLRPAGMTERDAELAVDAVVRTALDVTRAPARTTVAFYDNDAQPLRPLDLDGDAFAAGDSDTFLAPIQISAPTESATVPAGTVTISGRAAAVEANVLWEIEDATGTAIKEGHTTASECCTLAPYSFTVDLQPGTYLIVVHDEDMSGENRPVNQDTKRIVVR